MGTLIITKTTCHKCGRTDETSRYDKGMKRSERERKKIVFSNCVAGEENCCGAGKTEEWTFINSESDRVIIWDEYMMPDIPW